MTDKDLTLEEMLEIAKQREEANEALDDKISDEVEEHNDKCRANQ